MTATHRVAALDARGHGESERRPEDVSLEARVADVVFAIEQHHLAPVTLIGQSLGATAACWCRRTSELVRRWCSSMPAPRKATRRSSATRSPSLASWPDPQFDLDVMERTLRETLGRSFWPEWDRLACPTLVLLGENGIVARGGAGHGRRDATGARVIEIPGAGHDLHLDSPADWRAALTTTSCSAARLIRPQRQRQDQQRAHRHNAHLPSATLRASATCSERSSASTSSTPSNSRCATPARIPSLISDTNSGAIP